MRPIKLIPIFKNYLWGGTKLKKIYNHLETNLPVAEAWLLSTNKDGETKISNDYLDEESFIDYLSDNKGFLGTNVKNSTLPILIKLIDAKENLSIQVHPDDGFAAAMEGDFGKTEMWYIIESENEAFIYLGLKESVTREKYQVALEDNTIEQLLNKIYTEPGDVFYIPAGTIHAIGSGNLIAEIQQNSNITYRIFDYNRTDPKGNERELHLEQALRVSNLEKLPINTKNVPRIKSKTADYSLEELITSQYFTVKKLRTRINYFGLVSSESFLSIICTEKEGILEVEGQKLKFKKGDSFFLPALNMNYKITGEATLLLTSI